MHNEQLTEQLAALMHGLDGMYDPASYLDDAEDIISQLGLDHWIAPDTLQAKLKSLEEAQAKSQRMLAEVEQKRQVLAITLDQIQGAQQILRELLKGGGE